jgi:hypothetical protein
MPPKETKKFVEISGFYKNERQVQAYEAVKNFKYVLYGGA